MNINCPVCRGIHGLKKLVICDNIYTTIICKYLSNAFMDEFRDKSLNNNQENFKCTKCNKQFTTKQSMDYHTINNVCDKLNELKCMNCNKTFATKQRLDYHIDNGVCGVCEELDNREKLSKQNLKNVNNGNIHNGNQNIQTNIGTLNINVNANTNSLNSVQEMAEMLPFRDVCYKIPTKKYLEYVNNPDQAIKQFVKDYHLNPNKPERMNVLNTNRRDNRVQLFDFDEDFICRWQTKDKSKVLELLCDRGVNALFFAKTMLAAAGIKLDPKKETALNAKIKEYESSDKVKKRYIDMIGDLTYDYRVVVEINKKKYDNLIKN